MPPTTPIPPSKARISLITPSQTSPPPEILTLGPCKIRILEDGSNTNNRLGSMIMTLPPKISGPPMHWHRMHDETFLVLKGKIRFTSDEGDVDAGAGEYVVVPVKSIHTFSNPFDEEAEFFNTFTPAFYIDYLRHLSKKAGEAEREGRKLSEVEQREIMGQWATFSPGDEGLGF